MNVLIDAVLLGVGATIFMDVYALIIKKLWNIPSLDYRILGRWIGHFKDGVFSHPNIIQATPVQGEKALGWLAHYSIGIAFAFVLLLIWGEEWLVYPTAFPAIFIGLATTLAPWFMMQPAFGFGIAASKLPNPTTARLRSLQAHLIYGIGLYLAGLFISILFK
ncbi:MULTISPECIES: DUF2938 domain-containing protein [unclassified Chryseobacterium]|uniref:DUF2938 domain-containing protein n=1 Tax=unclassified Chryseobacterium TaxID=2593645 RepID=UPI00100B5A61|nr:MULTISPECIES: DUF2938 domain-containing protein [unclassified Chryseobacterium]RXM53244.1 hypothetical protein BOQ64_02355 [Chryseobacterium sp. CH25]RXM65559.1 hypothetical protein BOQ60_07135 [Chryseobacterium sp. CH1]